MGQRVGLARAAPAMTSSSGLHVSPANAAGWPRFVLCVVRSDRYGGILWLATGIPRGRLSVEPAGRDAKVAARAFSGLVLSVGCHGQDGKGFITFRADSV